MRATRRTRATVPAALVLVVASLASMHQGRADLRGVPARVVAMTPEENAVRPYASWDCGPADPAGCITAAEQNLSSGRRTTEWRVVLGTGNCCEIHTATTSDGRLFDIGGRYLNFTDDGGATWSSVRPRGPLANGEGSVVVAPNGDVLGIEWDPYSGDHLISYRFEAATGRWSYLEAPLHEPFYDRPWISVVPGPFSTLTGQIPYIAIIEGGIAKEPLLISKDGLRYTRASSPAADALLSAPVTSWAPIEAASSADWTQPITASPVVPLGAGAAWARSGHLLDARRLRWREWRLPSGGALWPGIALQIDGAGRIHRLWSENAGTLRYEISADGGRTWSRTPFGIEVGHINDFKVNASLGIAAFTTRFRNQDWAYTFDVSENTPRLMRIYKLGLGDESAAVGLGTTPRTRYDFKTISILPDGRIATSFLDGTTTWRSPGVSGLLSGVKKPALAIELLPRAS